MVLIIEVSVLEAEVFPAKAILVSRLLAADEFSDS